MHEETNGFMINSVEIEQSLMNSLSNSHNPSNLSLIDSFKKSYSHLNITLDSIAKNLDSIIEIDKHINLKSKAIAYVNQTQQFYEKSFQYTLKTFNESELTSDRSNEDKLSLNIAKQDLDDFKSILLSAAQKFETTYKITQEELKKYGL